MRQLVIPKEPQALPLESVSSTARASVRISQRVCDGVFRHAYRRDLVGNGPRCGGHIVGEKWRQSGLLLSIMAWGRVLKPEKASDTLGLALPDEGGGSCILRDEEREHLAAETLVEREVTADCDDLVIGMGPRLIHADSQLHGG
jgi:hypothetical protein